MVDTQVFIFILQSYPDVRRLIAVHCAGSSLGSRNKVSFIIGCLPFAIQVMHIPEDNALHLYLVTQ